MIIIESKENSLFKNVKKLKERKNRAREKKYIIEGFRLVEEGFKAGADIECLIIEEGNEQKANEFLKDYLTASKVYLMKKSLFSQLIATENTQGVLAVVNMNNSTEEIKGDFYLLCDKVQDPGNLGTIIRTAHAAGASGIILTKGTVDIYNDKTIRSTMGSVFYLPIKEDGFSLVTTSLQESKNFFEEDLRGKVILGVGNEGNGISDEIFAMSDKKVKIPMPGGAESLNVAVASSIILFEKVRQGMR